MIKKMAWIQVWSSFGRRLLMQVVLTVPVSDWEEVVESVPARAVYVGCPELTCLCFWGITLAI